MVERAAWEAWKVFQVSFEWTSRTRALWSWWWNPQVIGKTCFIYKEMHNWSIQTVPVPPPSNSSFSSSSSSLFFSVPIVIIIIINFWANMKRILPPGPFHFSTLRYCNAKSFSFRQCIKERCTCIWLEHWENHWVKYCENAMFLWVAVSITLVKE